MGEDEGDSGSDSDSSNSSSEFGSSEDEEDEEGEDGRTKEERLLASLNFALPSSPFSLAWRQWEMGAEEATVARAGRWLKWDAGDIAAGEGRIEGSDHNNNNDNNDNNDYAKAFEDGAGGEGGDQGGKGSATGAAASSNQSTPGSRFNSTIRQFTTDMLEQKRNGGTDDDVASLIVEIKSFKFSENASFMECTKAAMPVLLEEVVRLCTGCEGSSSSSSSSSTCSMKKAMLVFAEVMTLTAGFLRRLLVDTGKRL